MLQKNFTAAQKDVILREMSSLNLTKYVGEVAAAMVEAKLKMTDLQAAVEICSSMHQRYGEFGEHLLENWRKIMSLKKDEKVSNPSKLRVDLRFYSETVSVGIFTLKEGLPLLGQVLTTLVALDKEEHANVAIVLTFCKHCGDDYAGLVPRKIRLLADKHRYEVPAGDLLPPEKKRNVLQLLRDYYQTVCKHLVSEYKELNAVERSNRRTLLTKGEVHANRTDKAEALQASFSKLLTSAEQLSDLLDLELPELIADEAKRREDELDAAENEDAMVEESALGSLWEDEEDKSFYENLTDLKAFIPAILYKDSSQTAGVGNATTEGEAKTEEVVKEEEAAEDIEEELAAEMEMTPEETAADEEDVAPPDLEGAVISVASFSQSVLNVAINFFQTMPKNLTIRTLRPRCCWTPSLPTCLPASAAR